MGSIMRNGIGVPAVAIQATFQTERDRLRVQKKSTPGKATRSPRTDRAPPAGCSPSFKRTQGTDSSSPAASCGTTAAHAQTVRRLHVGHQTDHVSYLHSRDLTYRSSVGGPTTKASATEPSIGWDMPGILRTPSSTRSSPGPNSACSTSCVLPSGERPRLRNIKSIVGAVICGRLCR